MKLDKNQLNAITFMIKNGVVLDSGDDRDLKIITIVGDLLEKPEFNPQAEWAKSRETLRSQRLANMPKKF